MRARLETFFERIEDVVIAALDSRRTRSEPGFVRRKKPCTRSNVSGARDIDIVELGPFATRTIDRRDDSRSTRREIYGNQIA